MNDRVEALQWREKAKRIGDYLKFGILPCGTAIVLLEDLSQAEFHIYSGTQRLQHAIKIGREEHEVTKAVFDSVRAILQLP